ncbi:MAG: AEC family transporter [Muribaculaceae bacterium]|nr:AEC family transporter [Muribaculaceae bacterium]MCH5243013.1 AEC family transporter [Muribaculaceae bacterium]
MDIGHVIVYAIIPILVVMLAGYLSGKKGAFNGEDSKKFNKVVLVYALPAALFVSIAKSNRHMLVEDIKLSIVSVVGIMACFMAVFFIFLAFRNNKPNPQSCAAVSALISGSPTIGFLGFAVLEPIFDATIGLTKVALVVAIIGIVVNAIGIPVGLSLLNSGIAKADPAHKGQAWWKPVVHALAQPVAWAPILATIWVIIGIPWPDWASPSFDLIKGANASMAVFSAGITLSSLKITINWQAILGSILKMIMMPAVILILCLIFKMEYYNVLMTVVACALPPAFSGIIIADEYGVYTAIGTSSLTLSVILFMGFCPLWIIISRVCMEAHLFGWHGLIPT